MAWTNDTAGRPPVEVNSATLLGRQQSALVRLDGAEDLHPFERRLRQLEFQVGLLSQDIQQLAETEQRDRLSRLRLEDRLERLALADPFLECGAVREGW